MLDKRTEYRLLGQASQHLGWGMHESADWLSAANAINYAIAVSIASHDYGERLYPELYDIAVYHDRYDGDHDFHAYKANDWSDVL